MYLTETQILSLTSKKKGKVPIEMNIERDI